MIDYQSTENQSMMEENVDKGNLKVKGLKNSQSKTALDQFDADINAANAKSSAMTLKNQNK